MSQEADVVVVGAGPAGSIAALVLARAGRSVILLERQKFPRPKICGNCLNPRAWAIWEALGLTDRFAALPHAALTGFSVFRLGKRVVRHSFGEGWPAPRAIARERLDDWLKSEAEAAGVRFLEEVAITGGEPVEGRLETSAGDFRARLIVAADGRNSVVARRAGLMPPPQRCHRLAWQTTIPTPPGSRDEIEMHVYRDGYFGLARFDADRSVISLVLDQRAGRDPLAMARRRFPDLPACEWLRMSPVTRAPASVGRGRVWLVGDAARVVEPFTGEGIYFALATGLLAGRWAEQLLAGTAPAAALAGYAREHARFYRRRAGINRLLRWALISPRRLVGVLGLVRYFPALARPLARAVHGGSDSGPSPARRAAALPPLTPAAISK